MTSRMPAPPDRGSERLNCDFLVVGAGVVGLWIARHAARAGHSVIVLERRSAGSGASGGILGALMPHMPERWNPKKQFQFEALSSLAGELGDLESETGIDCGYRRCGRLMPLKKPHHRELAIERKAAAQQHWDTGRTGFHWTVRDGAESPGWPAAKSAPHGLVHENLAARVSPRRYLAALKASVEKAATLIEGEGYLRWDGAARQTMTTRGRVISARRTILTAGHETFTMLADLLGRPAVDFGAPVKGQAALLQTDVTDDLPLVFHDGVYLVPHGGGAIAVGSTSEPEFEDAATTDEKLDKVLERAVDLCPAVAGAPIIERWAGLRPKATRRDPMIGPIPGHPDLFVATGGFKITFGIAHKMAASALRVASDGDCASLPESFRLESHLR